MKYQPVPPMPAPHAVPFAIPRLPGSGGFPRPAPANGQEAVTPRVFTGAPRSGG